jgi:ribonuclease HI
VQTIEIYTDGGCHGNPGPGGWAFVAVIGDERVERAGSDPETTNNRMELQAVIEALAYAEKRTSTGTISVHTDSQYVKNGITQWIHTWLANGWQTAAKKPVKNRELWSVLHGLDTSLKPTWKWVRGHSGNPLNERCDALVQDAIKTAASR